MLFSNIEQVTELSGNITTSLDGIQTEDEGGGNKVGVVFREFASKIKEVYGTYCRNHDSASQLLEKVSLCHLDLYSKIYTICTVQYSTVQYTVQYSIQYSIQYSTVQCSIIQYSRVEYSTSGGSKNLRRRFLKIIAREIFTSLIIHDGCGQRFHFLFRSLMSYRDS